MLHLGNGCSAAAIRGGHSVDTSMGLTPLEGAGHGHTVGDFDPAIIDFLASKKGSRRRKRRACSTSSRACSGFPV